MLFLIAGFCGFVDQSGYDGLSGRCASAGRDSTAKRVKYRAISEFTEPWQHLVNHAGGLGR
jgi:hypothetical protein